MTSKLVEPSTVEQLSRRVENGNGTESIEEFLESLSLPDDEEATIVSSLKMLPSPDVRPSGMPKAPPSVMSHEFWL